MWRALRGKPTTDADEKKTPWPVAIPIGIAGGILSGVFSVGGAVFAVPVLSIVFGISQAAAQGLGLALVALDAATGAEKWRFQVEKPRRIRLEDAVARRGLAWRTHAKRWGRSRRSTRATSCSRRGEPRRTTSRFAPRFTCVREQASRRGS